MEMPAASQEKSDHKLVRWLLNLVAITVALSLLYAVLFYLGGPVRLAVVTEVLDLAFKTDGEQLAVAAQDGTVWLYDVSRDWAATALSDHEAPVIDVAISPDGSSLVSVDQEGEVRIWQVPGGRVEKAFSTGGPVSQAAVAADGSVLATLGGDDIIRTWELPSGDQLQSIGPEEGVGLSVAVSADGSLVAAGVDDKIGLWDSHTGALVRTLEGYWEDETQEDWLGHDEEVTALAFSPDGEMLASGSADTTINFWGVDTGEVIWPSEGHWGTVTKLVFNAEGDLLLSGGKDNKVRSFRVAGGRSTALYEGHVGTINGVAFGPTPDTILTAANDGSVRLWETANQKVQHIEWPRYGLQSVWGDLFGIWTLVSGVLGAICLVGLRRRKTWSHLVTLALFLVGPIVVLGLPLLEALSYPISTGIKLQIGWPLVLLAAWYSALVVLLMRDSVVAVYEAPRDVPLADRLVISQRTAKSRFGIFGLGTWMLVLVLLYSVLRRFNLDIAFMGHFFSFIMQGSWITLRISAISILLAVVLALVGALGRLSKNPAANGLASFYVSLIRGTPLLVQVYIWYLGLPRLDIVLPGELAGILALGVNYGAYMSETFRAGIQAIGKGQYEAAQALGMTRGQTFRRIVLPQAFRIVIPPIGNDFIAMMKDSSLVSVMAIWELTYRAQKIGRQNFRNMETFIIAAAFYWLLTVVFQFLQGKLEDYMARGERR